MSSASEFVYDIQINRLLCERCQMIFVRDDGVFDTCVAQINSEETVFPVQWIDNIQYYANGSARLIRLSVQIDANLLNVRGIWLAFEELDILNQFMKTIANCKQQFLEKKTEITKEIFELTLLF